MNGHDAGRGIGHHVTTYRDGDVASIVNGYVTLMRDTGGTVIIDHPPDGTFIVTADGVARVDADALMRAAVINGERLPLVLTFHRLDDDGGA